MAPLPAKELLAQLEALVESPPAELANDATLRTQLSVAAKKASLALEKPEDVVARVLLSQVSFASNSQIHLGTEFQNTDL
jgi:hypothetical protein